MSEGGDYERAIAILNLVLDRTRAGVFDWRETNMRSDAYTLELPSGSVEVGTSDNDGVAPYDFRIYSRGPAYSLVHKLDSRDDVEAAESIGALWVLARRQVSGVDETLEGLLKDLEDEPPF